jgi:hypothetical protein
MARLSGRGLEKIAAYRDSDGDLHLNSASHSHVGCHLHFNSFETCWDLPLSRLDVQRGWMSDQCSCHRTTWRDQGIKAVPAGAVRGAIHGSISRRNKLIWEVPMGFSNDWNSIFVPASVMMTYPSPGLTCTRPQHLTRLGAHRPAGS